jgi:hypothetical protein
VKTNQNKENKLNKKSSSNFIDITAGVNEDRIICPFKLHDEENIYPAGLFFLHRI